MITKALNISTASKLNLSKTAAIIICMLFMISECKYVSIFESNKTENEGLTFKEELTIVEEVSNIIKPSKSTFVFQSLLLKDIRTKKAYLSTVKSIFLFHCQFILYH